MPNQLTPHFTLEELCVTSTGIINKPTAYQIKRLTQLAKHILEPIRAEFGAFTPNSAFRNLKVNKAVGGLPTSQHTRGEAVDITHPKVSPRVLATWIKNNLQYDQLILEDGWVHVSYNMRGENFDINKGVVKGASF
jgi:zinc D-Ala-D-Ala carboxypeptidase